MCCLWLVQYHFRWLQARHLLGLRLRYRLAGLVDHGGHWPGRPPRRRSDPTASAVCSRIAYSDQKRPWCSYLLPAGEGAPQGRMRAELRALARKSPHPAVPARPRKRGSPRSPREKERRPRRACNSTVKRARLRSSSDVPVAGGMTPGPGARPSSASSSRRRTGGRATRNGGAAGGRRPTGAR